MIGRVPQNVSRAVVILTIAFGVLGSLLGLFISNPYITVYPPGLVIAGIFSVWLARNENEKVWTEFHIRPKLLLIAYLSSLSLLLIEYATAVTRTPIVLFFTFLLYALSIVAVLSDADWRLVVILV
ncbi:hypothetical protein, partial [Haloferax profundi]|uniref:hypothetical protein n=1 Tax=Haloferax profundi TaxID=1544718 RepID=UPI001E341191